MFAARSSGWPELATLWPKVAKVKKNHVGDFALGSK